jgi:hypothetical protein
MQYSLVNNEKVEAFPKGKGICPMCQAPTIAKCGTRNINHWAHDRKMNCDPWWENETEWHRNWKNLFAIECREITHFAEDGEMHRADIKTKTNIIIEFQHSAITDEERLSREIFYKNLVWVVDGRPFKENFDLYHMLPNPESEMATDIVWTEAKRHMEGANKGIFFRLSDSQLHCISEINEELEQNYNGFHQYDWVRPRRTWLNATCPVYIDFGDNCLYQLKIYNESKLKCVRLISKRKFIHDVSVETHVSLIGTRYYKIS